MLPLYCRHQNGRRAPETGPCDGSRCLAPAATLRVSPIVGEWTSGSSYAADTRGVGAGNFYRVTAANGSSSGWRSIP